MLDVLRVILEVKEMLVELELCVTDTLVEVPHRGVQWKKVNPMFSQLGVNRVFKGEGSSFGNELLMLSLNQWNSHSSWKKAQQPRHCKDRPSLEVHPQDIARDSHVCCWQIVFNLVDLEILKHLETS